MKHQPKQGRIVGMTNADYHSQESISKSGLDLIARSPELFRFRKENPVERTEAMRIGTLSHTAILEPHEMANWLIEPIADGRTKEGKQIKAEFAERAKGRDVVTQRDMEMLAGIKAAVWAHPAAGKALGMLQEVETSLFWTDEETGIDCRCRPDGVLDNGLLIDVKTTQDARPDEFAKSIANFRYHVQAAFYSDGYEKIYGVKPTGFMFIVVEKHAPYQVACYVASEAMTIRGRAEYQKDLATYKKCLAENSWPGIATEPTIIDLPKWA